MAAHDPKKIAADLPEMEFKRLADFNDGHVGVFWGTAGESPWELHPNDEELLHVLEGEVEIEILGDRGSDTTLVRAGELIVVPRGHWHRHRVPERVVELYLTPGATEHSMADDPRTA